MTSVVNRPSLLRKYIYEYCLIALAACVVFLFYALNDLNADMRRYLLDDRQQLIKTVAENTNAINQFNLIQRSK
jgi:hypothetical protein